MDKKEVIKALDETLDKEIVHYAKKFIETPSVKTLSILDRLVTVDMYTDKYLAEHEEVEARTVSMATK